MPRIQITPASRITHDPQSRAIRTWFDTTVAPAAKAPFIPRDVARQVLQQSADLFRWPTELPDLRERGVENGVHGISVTFTQEFKGVPVDASEVLVNLYQDSRVYSIYNNYHYDIPADLDPGRIKVKGEQATQLVERLVERFKKHELTKPVLLVYQYSPFTNRPPKPSQVHDQWAGMVERLQSEGGEGGRPVEGRYYLVWDIKVLTLNPRGKWRMLIDAVTGALVNMVDLAQYATGSGRVFDPNPIVTSGNTGLSSTTPVATLDGLANGVVMDRLDPPDAAGKLHLDGRYVHLAEIESPTFAEPTSALGDFIFSFTDRNFVAGMAYFHIDRFQDYVQTTLGLTNVANYSIPVDPQGFSGADNSHYVPNASPGTGILAFGEGGIPDASDAMVVLHEYGHAIQDNAKPGFNNPTSGVGEGFGDFLAAVYYDDKHANPAVTRGIMMSWDANTTDHTWAGRRYDRTYNFDDPQYTGQADNHLTGELWCTTMFELYRKLGGDSQWYPNVRLAARDLAIRLHLMANFHVPASNATAQQMAEQVEAADGGLGAWAGLANGLHKKVIYDTFRRRHLPGFPNKSVDVYINDGREGGYGSLSGNDLFAEVLWQDNYWETQDIWVKPSRYANAAAQAAGSPADHIEPPVASEAYLYVRVKNRGTAAGGSGPVNVRAFHCAPGIGLVWPDNWVEMDATEVTPVTNILPGAGNGIVVGPFKWTPTEVGHECVLAIAECANDRATTQDLLATDHVRHSDLVPFDNNIAQRNLAPTAAKAGMKRGFYLNNPDTVARAIRLHFTSTLPNGWTWRTNLVNSEEVRLGPLERRWVELVIDQASGQEVTRFDQQQRLTVTGTIEGRLIGGMTFYVAPPTAFAPRTSRPDDACPLRPSDLLSMNIPWKDCDLEGEIDVKLRFRCKRQC